MRQIRDMTEAELDRLERGECPVCGEKVATDELLLGPSGGESRNVKMPCGAKINIIDPETYGWPPPMRFGQII
jgi:hypothetical protein